MSEVKNQHYISQRILEKFANEKNQVVEALVGKGRFYRTNFRQSMSEKYTYEHPMLEKNKLEKFFGNIEGYFTPALNQIISQIKQYENKLIKLEDIKSIVEKYMNEFIIFYYRSGALLHEFSFEMVNLSDKIFLLLENIMNSKYIRELSKTIIHHYDFSIIKSKTNSFLLSDQYISTASLNVKGRFLNLSNRHLGMKNVLFLIPLSSEYYIVYSNGKTPEYIKANKLNLLTEQEETEINQVIINNSYTKCIGYHEQPVKEALKSFKYYSPVGTIAQYENGGKFSATVKKEIFFHEEDKKLWDFFINHRYSNFINVNITRNQNCLCNSGLKFKKCCMSNYNSSMRILDNMHYQRYEDIFINPDVIIERGINEFYTN